MAFLLVQGVQAPKWISQEPLDPATLQGVAQRDRLQEQEQHGEIHERSPSLEQRQQRP